MMRKGIKHVAIIVFAMLLLSSCNRGVGCPSDFSMDVQIGKIVSMVFDLLKF